MRLKLRKLRERRLLTQGQLAMRAGMSKSTISRLENDLQQARISTVRKLAEALGVSAEELIENDGKQGHEHG